MGTSVKYGPTIHHSGRPCHALALYPTSARIRGQLVWLCSQPALGTSHQDDCNSTTSASTGLVHTQLPEHPPSRSHSLCSDLHRVALVFQSLWQDKSGYYYVFGFLSVVSIILILTIAEVTIVTIYISLCNENYNWWWHSFFVGGGSAVWVFLYCIWYYFMKLHVTGFVSSMLFFAYSGIACVVYGLLCGTVGFLTAYTFVRRIYGAIKAD